VPNHSVASLASTPVTLRPGALLCIAALVAIGCGSGGTGLEDTARNISRRSSQQLEHSGNAGAGAEDGQAADGEDQGVAGAGDEAADDGADEMADESAPADPTPTPPTVPDAPVSDDSVRCGNGVRDMDELCDITIAEGEEGACPVLDDCPMFDACHAPKLEVRGCWTQCVLGEMIEDCSL
jgi:hypothetical protein